MTMHRIAATALLVAGMAFLPACVMPDQISQVEKGLEDVRRELREVQQQQTETRDAMDAIRSETGDSGDAVSRADFADVTLDMDRLEREVAVTDERLSDLNRRFDRMLQEVRQTKEMNRASATSTWSATTAPPGTSDEPMRSGEVPAVSGAIPDAEALYNTAYADFSKGNYALAVSGFEEYVDKFPDSPLADNALYWIGECHFSQGDFPKAIATFDGLLGRYPRSDKAAAGNLKKALAYLEQNQIGQAIVQLRFVMSSYPGSDESKIARDKLTSLGAPI